MTAEADAGAPASQRILVERIEAVADEVGMPFLRIRRTIAHTVVGQMLPPGVLKGGGAMRLRVTEPEARLTEDLDFSPVADLTEEEFAEQFSAALERGWHEFSGRLVDRRPASPKGVPPEYVMKPYEVKLSYAGKPLCTVIFELGHDEVGSAEDGDRILPDDIVAMFETIGLPTPEPIAVMSASHQAAQKLHACTSVPDGSFKNDRAHDLVDLQILNRVDGIDPGELHAFATRLFAYRKAQDWPSTVVVRGGWDDLYRAAAEGLKVLPTVEEAAEWANQLIASAASGAEADPAGL